MSLEPGTRFAGRFLIECAAGQGGMGTVYRAFDDQTGRTVALKLIQGTGALQEFERFRREGDILASLQHEKIVEHVAHGIAETGQPYLAMAWLDGEDLAQRLTRGRLTVREVQTLLWGIAQGLRVAHERGVVHRDLKPSNIVAEAEGGN